MSGKFTLVTRKPDLYLKFWAHFQRSTQQHRWTSSRPLQPDQDKTDLLSFTSKSAIPVVLFISVNGLSIHLLAQANVLSVGNFLKNIAKSVHFFLFYHHCPNSSVSHLDYSSSLFAGLSIFTLAFNLLLHILCTLSEGQCLT